MKITVKNVASYAVVIGSVAFPVPSGGLAEVDDADAGVQEMMKQGVLVRFTVPPPVSNPEPPPTPAEIEAHLNRIEQELAELQNAQGQTDGRQDEGLADERRERGEADAAHDRNIAANAERLAELAQELETLRQAMQNIVVTPEQLDAISKKINDIKVGGRNYVRNSNFSRQLTDWDNWGAADRNIINAHGRQWLRLTAQGAGRYRGVQQVLAGFAPNTPYTVSFDAYAVSGGAVVGIHQIGANLDPQIWRNFALTATPQRIRFSFVSAGGADKVRFRLMLGGSDGGFDICIANIKFEQGSLATDWSPAPEDGDAATAAVAAELRTIKSQIEQQLEQLRTQVDSAANRNLIYPHTNQQRQYVNDSDGALLTLDNHVVTDYIAVASGQSYVLISSPSADRLRYVWFNRDKGYISGRLIETRTHREVLTAPPDAAFVRISGGVNNNVAAFSLYKQNP